MLVLNQTLEDRVEEQTRDIHSIMEHIQLSIFAIEGEKQTIHKDYSAHWERLIEAENLAGQLALPLTRQRRDGHMRQLELRWNPIVNNDEELEKILVIENDATEIRKLESIARENAEDLGLVSGKYLRARKTLSAAFCAIAGNSTLRIERSFRQPIRSAAIRKP